MRVVGAVCVAVSILGCKSDEKPAANKPAAEKPAAREQPDTELLRRLEGPLETGVAAWLRSAKPEGLAPIVAGSLPPEVTEAARELPIASVELVTVEASVYWFSAGPTVRTDFRWLVTDDKVATVGFAATTPRDGEHHERRSNDSTDLRDIAEGFQAIPRAIELGVRAGKTACITPAFPADASVIPEPLRPLLTDDLAAPLADMKSREIRLGGTCETLRSRQPFKAKHVAPGAVHFLAKDAAGKPVAIVSGTLVQLRERGMPLQLSLTKLQRL